MGRSTLRLTAVAIVTGALSTLGSTAPASPRTIDTTSLVAAAIPVDPIDRRPERIPPATPST